tara:strand:+ start:86 stop:556 length:471 start_codon:yes stop_codon:yes gene_type:complete
MRLKDKVALVTGASGGLGAGICEAFAGEGADCLVIYRSDKVQAEETASTVRSLGRRAKVIKTDVSNEGDVRKMFEIVRQVFGRLDILVANAGVGISKALLDSTLGDFEQMIRTNLIGTYLTVREGAQLMRRQKAGKIITMSSVHGLGGTYPSFLSV